MVGKEMRIKNKLYCDYCGKYLRELTKKQMQEIIKARKEGTMLCYIAECKSCSR
jgi:hypothetical protein